jgi:uncharacterized protein (TIGR01244 family)
MTFRKLDEAMFVAGQIAPRDVDEAAKAGIVSIINNRPDGEEPGQVAGAAIEAAAQAAGIAYRHIPVAGGFSADQVAAMADSLDSANGPVLAFCKSGTRSTFLWALARAQGGADGATLIAQAAAAGYDLAPLRSYLG